MSMKQIREILVLHHCHTDIGFTHPQPILWDLQRRFIDEAIDLCEATAEWPEASRVRWTCETTAPILHWLEGATDRQIERFRELVQRGQMAAGAFYLHCTPIGTATQMAHSLEPILRLRRDLDLPLKVAISHDVNGLPWTFTQLLADAGIEMVLSGINVHFGGYPLYRPMAFRWQGADERELLVFNGEHYNSFNQQLGVVQNDLDLIEERLAVYWQRITVNGTREYPHDFLFLTSTHSFNADNNPPSRATAEVIRRWNAEGRLPVIRYVTPEMLMERLEPVASGLPAHRGDWPDYWAFGCGSGALETRIHLQAGTRLRGAEMLMAHSGHATRRQQETLERVRVQADLFNEHTWSSFSCVEHPDRDGVIEQWMHKAALAWNERSLASLTMRDALEGAAGNPTSASGLQGVLLYNPGPEAARVCPRIFEPWLEGVWEHYCSSAYGLDDQFESLEDSATGVKTGPFEVPAHGFRMVPREELVRLKEEGLCERGEDFIQSPFFRLGFDAETGRILSLRDRRIDREIVDGESAVPFFGFVTETVDPSAHDHGTPHGGRDAFFTLDWEMIHADTSHWRSEWPASRAAARKLRGVRTECDGEGVSVILSWEDESAFRNLEQRVTLPAFRETAEFSVSFLKTDVRTAEGTYLAFPLAMGAWEAWYDTADMPVRLDVENIPGACRDYLAVGSYAAMADDHHAIVLACPDAPMVQFGDFSFGRKLAKVPRNPRPLLLAWLTNNYWNTNFRASQPGPLRFRYELRASRAFDPAAAARAGAMARSRIEVHPVAGQSRAAAERCMSLEGEGLVLLQAAQDASDPNCILARIINVSSRQVRGSVGCASPIVAASLCSVLGETRESTPIEDGQAILDIPARRLVTLRLFR